MEHTPHDVEEGTTMHYLAVPTPGIKEPGSMDERQARIVLSMLAEPGDVRISQLVTDYGAIEALARIVRPDVWDDHALIDEHWLARVPTQESVDRLFRKLADLQIETVIPGDREWPIGMNELIAPPLVLYVRGNADALGLGMVGVVGSRAATGYGEHVTQQLVGELGNHGFGVVSGGAYGIDGAAHRSALATGVATVAVLAGGVDRPYPTGHESLFERILNDPTSALVSEVPPGTAPTKWRFLQRNRLIAAMSSAVVVVEAGFRSGSLNTAGHAKTLGIPLGAVPGPLTSAASNGTNYLLRDRDVWPITSARDIRDLAEEGRLTL